MWTSERWSVCSPTGLSSLKNSAAPITNSYRLAVACGAVVAPAGDEVTPEERSALHTVGAAGLVAFVDVYDSLETAAK